MILLMQLGQFSCQTGPAIAKDLQGQLQSLFDAVRCLIKDERIREIL